MFKVGIITSSDSCSKGEKEDLSGKLISKMLNSDEFKVVGYTVLPDEIDLLANEMKYLADEMKVDLILTTGGTGFSNRDVTPEATISICDKMANGICEAIRQNSMQYTKRAMLSRAVSGIRKNTLIINLPGSPKAVEQSLSFIVDTLIHGLEILTSKTKDCAKKD